MGCTSFLSAMLCFCTRKSKEEPENLLAFKETQIYLAVEAGAKKKTVSQEDFYKFIQTMIEYNLYIVKVNGSTIYRNGTIENPFKIVDTNKVEE